MNSYNKDFGSLGEQAACTFLTKKGYTVIEKNYRCKAGEIDIIAKINGCTVFVEVKTRTSDNYGTPAQAVDYRKQSKIKQLIAFYSAQHKLNCDMCFDVIEVYAQYRLGQFSVKEINHIENVWL